MNEDIQIITSMNIQLQTQIRVLKVMFIALWQHAIERLLICRLGAEGTPSPKSDLSGKDRKELTRGGSLKQRENVCNRRGIEKYLAMA